MPHCLFSSQATTFQQVDKKQNESLVYLKKMLHIGSNPVRPIIDLCISVFVLTFTFPP